MKHSMIKTSIICASLFLPFTAIAQVRNFGSFDCGFWVKNQNTKPLSDSEIVVKTWLYGYLSGLNSVLATPKNDPLSQITDTQVNLWMDKYCRDEPLSNIQAGANILYQELERRRKK